MMFTFKQFIEHNNFVCSLFEQDAAPPSGMPDAPVNPDNKTTNKHHFDTLQRELGIEDIGSALEGNSIPIFKVPDYSSKWGYLVSGPCTATVRKRFDGNFNITFQLKEKKLMEPHSFIKPYKKGEKPIMYQGDVNNETETITAEELQDMMAKPYAPAIGGAGAPPSMPPGGPPL